MQTAADEIASTLTIRLLTSNDSLEDVTKLLHRAYAKHAENGLHYLATSQNINQTRKRIKNAECYVVEKNHRLVGTFCLWAPERTSGLPWYDLPEVAKATQIAVDADCQGLGIGRTMFQYMERRALEMGAVELALDTSHKAVDLVDTYFRYGYKIVHYTYWPNTNYRSVVLSKRLRGDQVNKLSFKARFTHLLWSWLRQMRNRFLAIARS